VAEVTGDSIARYDAAASFDARLVESPEYTELYINVRPRRGRDGQDQIAAIYGRLAAMLDEHAAQIFSERIFVGAAAASSIGAARRGALGNRDDGVPPTILLTPPLDDRIHGVQIHACRGDEPPKPIEHGGMLVGRRIDAGGRRWVHLTALTAHARGTPHAQAGESYEQAARVLRTLDMDLHCVARTWVWLRDILDWYPQFNDARTRVFAKEGLVASENNARFLPASTGIGVAPVDGSACGLELIAISDGQNSIRSSHAAGEQCSAFAYGSAFARAVRAPMPAGRALLVSGTAAIDADGASEHPGDIHRQIAATLQHVRSLLEEATWSESQIVSAIAYCKTDQVARVFAEEWATLSWPRLELIADICRDELLFELEATAVDQV
jgi:enamine deaminase RidA (YjgF/YER057c/UK114 family)